MNDKNLIPFSERSEKEQWEIRSKGGIASGKSKREKANLRRLAEILLAADVSNPRTAKKLHELGIEKDDATMAAAVNLAQLEKAIKGDVEAARFLRDTSGQRPAQGVEIGGVNGQPIEHRDLTGISDDELIAMAEQE